jgi:EAL domain-containing protein (putative c-di-GMP-specific phosphodiesterase class I)
VDKFSQRLADCQFQAYYQPQYDALTNALVGAEALVRWVREDGTVVAPEHFVPGLEATGAVVDLDWYIYGQVCAFLGRELAAGHRVVPISVNFSRWHVKEGDMVDHLCRVAEEHGVDRRYLILEITETAFLDDTPQIAAVMEQVRQAGFQVSIDDFGTGLSSLSFVMKIPADILKLDRSLISCNCQDNKERIVLESILSFAQRLKLHTVAEGVETRSQLGFLRTCGCQTIQGFLFARPMPEADFVQLLAALEEQEAMPEDILDIQASATATQLLLEAVFACHPLAIFCNLTRNSYYMMAYDHFITHAAPGAGIYTELVESTAATIHPRDREQFEATFSIPNQLIARARGEKSVRLLVSQRGDDGTYRKVEINSYFVQHPASPDVLVIFLCHPTEG